MYATLIFFIMIYIIIKNIKSGGFEELIVDKHVLSTEEISSEKSSPGNVELEIEFIKKIKKMPKQ